MGIDIYIASSMEEPYKRMGLPHVRMEDAMQEFIWKHQQLWKENIQIYLELEPYGDIMLLREQIKALKRFAEDLLNVDKITSLECSFHSQYSIDKKEYLTFAKELYALCQEALQTKQKLVSLGD